MEITVLTEKPLFHVYGKSIQRHGVESERRLPLTPATPAGAGKEVPRDNETEPSVRAPREQVVDYQATIVDHDAYRLTQEQSAILLMYVLFRLIFKVVALAGIKDFASRVAIECEKRNLALQLGHEAETVTLEEPTTPTPPKSKRRMAMPIAVLPPPPKPPPTPVVPPYIPGMPDVPFPPPPGFIVQPPPHGRGPPPPPGLRPEFQAPPGPGFLFPPPSVLPHPTMGNAAHGHR
ncbi:amyloid beta A4 precursor protein-binding family B member 1-interacting protein-like [Rhipicephalus sanguineus]|uniref:amyloid beta A4 precursor protein-binding family B member 1-interacting protein-like n=1 Tax=Rhipicephalus sanguineus TaxID=34632 RepID=UPI0018940F2A|nr:amyloid beta A4 precursor protein-binding family B member 1-interacting protein-like [Rhipicephalus sanguineus]